MPFLVAECENLCLLRIFSRIIGIHSYILFYQYAHVYSIFYKSHFLQVYMQVSYNDFFYILVAKLLVGGNWQLHSSAHLCIIILHHIMFRLMNGWYTKRKTQKEKYKLNMKWTEKCNVNKNIHVLAKLRSEMVSFYF